MNNTGNVIKVFLSWSSDGDSGLRNEVKNTLLRAGMQIVQPQNMPEDETALVRETKQAIDNSDCSVHILGSSYGKVLELNESVSIDKFQFLEAKKKIDEACGKYKMFVWYPPEVLAAAKDPLQEQFIGEIRNGIIKNMVFSNAGTAIRLADDIRSLMTFDEKTKFDIKEAEVFLIFNQLDEAEAEAIIDMLSDIIEPIEKLNIIQDSDMDYSEYCVQQIGMSKLVTIFFKDTANWALPFTQQIWKKAGGASSHTPILLIGTNEPESNTSKKFQAPRVVSLIIAGELIPLEIKVQYDNILEKT